MVAGGVVSLPQDHSRKIREVGDRVKDVQFVTFTPWEDSDVRDNKSVKIKSGVSKIEILMTNYKRCSNTKVVKDKIPSTRVNTEI